MRYIKIVISFLIGVFITLIFINLEKPINQDDVIINIEQYIDKKNNLKDHTEIIQNALDEIEGKNKTILYFPKGVYIFTSPITINNPAIIRGEEAIFKLSENFTSNKDGQGFFVSNSVNGITIDGITFDGNKDKLSADPKNNFVVFFRNSSNIIVKNSRVINLNGKGENLNSAFSFIGNSNDIIASKNIIENSDGGAIFFQGKDSKAIKNIAINLKDVAYVANGLGSKNIIFLDNIASNVSGGSIGVENGPSNIRVENNRIYDFTDGYGIGVLNLKDPTNSLSYNIKIEDNLIMGNSGVNPSNGIAIVRAEDVIVNNNIISDVNLNNTNNNSIYLGKETISVFVMNNRICSANAPGIVNSSKNKSNIIRNNPQIVSTTGFCRIK